MPGDRVAVGVPWRRHPGRQGWSVTVPTATRDATGRLTADPVWLLNLAYRAFNSREVEAAIALMCIDVDWPNTMEGGRELGHEAVRRYWSRLFRVLSPRVEPVGHRSEYGRVVVTVRQQIDDPRGRPLAYQHLRHVFAFRAGLVARMDVRGPPREASSGMQRHPAPG